MNRFFAFLGGEKIDILNFLKAHNYLNFQEHEPLAKHTTLKVGGVAQLLYTPKDASEFLHTLTFIQREKLPYKILGNGSNILCSDRFYPGIVIKNKFAFNGVKVDGNTVTAGSSVSMVKLAHTMAKMGKCGLEFISGIPGTIGGGIYMNAGAYNKEMQEIVLSVTYMDHEGNVRTVCKDDCGFSYRESRFKTEHLGIILGATLKVEDGDPKQSLALIQKRKERREQTQPLNHPSCGSVFRNPPGTHAYLLIDGVGLRGYQIGGAKFSELHCNFIITSKNARAQDVYDLIHLAETLVKEKYGIELIREVELFNW